MAGGMDRRESQTDQVAQKNERLIDWVHRGRTHSIPPSRPQAGWDFDAGALPTALTNLRRLPLPRAAHAAGDPWLAGMLHVAGAHAACAAPGCSRP